MAVSSDKNIENAAEEYIDASVAAYTAQQAVQEAGEGVAEGFTGIDELTAKLNENAAAWDRVTASTSKVKESLDFKNKNVFLRHFRKEEKRLDESNYDTLRVDQKSFFLWNSDIAPQKNIPEKAFNPSSRKRLYESLGDIAASIKYKKDDFTRVSSENQKDIVTNLFSNYFNNYLERSIKNSLSSGKPASVSVNSFLTSDLYKDFIKEIEDNYYLTSSIEYKRGTHVASMNAWRDNIYSGKMLKEGQKFDVYGRNMLPSDTIGEIFRAIATSSTATPTGFREYKENYWKTIANAKTSFFSDSDIDRYESKVLAGLNSDAFSKALENSFLHSLTGLGKYADTNGDNLKAYIYDMAGAYSSFSGQARTSADADKAYAFAVDKTKMAETYAKLQQMLEDELKVREKANSDYEQAVQYTVKAGMSSDDAASYLKQFAAAVRKADDEVRKTNLSMLHLQNAQDKANKTFRQKFTSSFKDSALSGLERYSKNFENRGGLTGAISKFSANFLKDSKLGHIGGSLAGGVMKGGVNVGGAVGGLATVAVEKLAKAIKNLGKESIDAFKEIETTRTNLGVVYGSQSEANASLNEIAQYATKSPFGVKQTADFAVLLKQSGVKDVDLMNTLKMIADTAGGSQEKFSRIANNYAQIVAQGKATSIDLRQFANAGIPIYELLKKQVGNLSTSEIRKKTAAGEITSELIEKAFEDATSEGGVFYGAVEKGAKTLSARLQNMQDIKQLNLSKVGELIYNAGDKRMGEDNSIFRSMLAIQEKIYGAVGNVADKLNRERKEDNAQRTERTIDNYLKEIDTFQKIIDAGGLNEKQIKAYQNYIDLAFEKIKEARALMPEDEIRADRYQNYLADVKKITEEYKNTLELNKKTMSVAASMGTYSRLDMAPETQFRGWYNNLQNSEEDQKNLRLVYLAQDAERRYNSEIQKYSSGSGFKALTDKEFVAFQKMGNVIEELSVALANADFDKVEEILTDIGPLMSDAISTTIDDMKTLREIIKESFTENELLAYYQTFGATQNKYQIQEVDKLGSRPDSVNSLMSFARQQYEQSDEYKEEKLRKEQEQTSKLRAAAETQKKYGMKDGNGWVTGVSAKEFSNLVRQNFFTFSDIDTNPESLRKGYADNENLIDIIKNKNLFYGMINNLLSGHDIAQYVNKNEPSYIDEWNSYINTFDEDYSLLKTAGTLEEKEEVIKRLSETKGKVEDFLVERVIKDLEDAERKAKKEGNTESVKEIESKIDILKDVVPSIFRRMELNEITPEMLNNSKINGKNVMSFWRRLTSTVMGVPQDVMKEIASPQAALNFWQTSGKRSQNESIAKAMLSRGASFADLRKQLVYNGFHTGTGDNSALSVNQERTNDNLVSLALSLDANSEVTEAYSGQLQTQLDQIRTLMAAGAFRMEESGMVMDTEKASKLGYAPKDISALERMINAFSFNKGDEMVSGIDRIYDELVKQTNKVAIIADIKNQIEDMDVTREKARAVNGINTSLAPYVMGISPDRYKETIQNIASSIHEKSDKSRSLFEITEEIKDASNDIPGLINQIRTQTKAEKKAAESAFNKATRDYDAKIQAIEKQVSDSHEGKGKIAISPKTPWLKYGAVLQEDNSKKFETYFDKSLYEQENPRPKMVFNKSEDLVLKEEILEALIKEINSNVNTAFTAALNVSFMKYGLENNSELQNKYHKTQKALKGEISEEKAGWSLQDIFNTPNQEQKAVSVLDAFDLFNLRSQTDLNGNAVTRYGENKLTQQRALNWIADSTGLSTGELSMKNVVSEIEKQDEDGKNMLKSVLSSQYDTFTQMGLVSGEEKETAIKDLDDALGTNNQSGLDEWLTKFGLLGEKADYIKSRFESISSTIKDTAKSNLLNGINQSFAKIGENLKDGEIASDGLYSVWKNIGSSILGTIGASMTSAGIEMVGAGAAEIRKGQKGTGWSLISSGLALAAAGGVASITSGLLSSGGSDDDDSDDGEEERIQNLKDALSDLIDQAKTDAEYYQKNLLHKQALTENSAVSVRSVNDAVITPSGNIVSTHPDDYLIATKTPDQLLGGGSGNTVIQVNPVVYNTSAANVAAKTEVTENSDGSMDITTIIYDVVKEGFYDGEFDSSLEMYDERRRGRSVAS